MLHNWLHVFLFSIEKFEHLRMVVSHLSTISTVFTCILLYLISNHYCLFTKSNLQVLSFIYIWWACHDGLAIVHKANGPKVDRLRIDIITLFKDEGLSITIDTNLIEADFLDVSYNLNTGKYFPFRKPNNACTSIYTFKIQPPTVNHQAIAIGDQQTHFKLILWRIWV